MESGVWPRARPELVGINKVYARMAGKSEGKIASQPQAPVRGAAPAQANLLGLWKWLGNLGAMLSRPWGDLIICLAQVGPRKHVCQSLAACFRGPAGAFNLPGFKGPRKHGTQALGAGRGTSLTAGAPAAGRPAA